MLGNSGLLLIVNCSVGKGKFCVLIETCAQCYIRACSAFNAHHVPQQAFKSHLLGVVLAHFQSWSCPSGFPEVSLGLHKKGAGADGECASAVTARDLEFLIGFWWVPSHLCFGDLCQSLRGESRWPLKWWCLVSISTILCWEPACGCWNETQQALGNPWRQHGKGRGSPGLPGWFDCD